MNHIQFDQVEREEQKKWAAVREIPAGLFLTVRFPWRSPLSFVAGYFKVDPALARHRAARGYLKVEALARYDGDTILYMQPVVKA